MLDKFHVVWGGKSTRAVFYSSHILKTPPPPPKSSSALFMANQLHMVLKASHQNISSGSTLNTTPDIACPAHSLSVLLMTPSFMLIPSLYMSNPY